MTWNNRGDGPRHASSPDPFDPDHDRRPPARGNLVLFLVVAIAASGIVVWLFSRYGGELDAQDDTAGLVRILAILAVVVLGILGQRRLGLSAGLRHLLVWGLIFAGLVTAYAFRADFEAVWRRVSGELWPHQAVTTSPDGPLTLRAARDGHFYLEARVNDAPVRFLVDTGASGIVLTLADARRAGFDPDTLAWTGRHSTAGGTVPAAPVRLDSLVVGPLRFADLAASVNDSGLDRSLLGIAFLDRFASWEVQGEVLRLYP